MEIARADGIGKAPRRVSRHVRLSLEQALGSAPAGVVLAHAGL
jgi:hypothetical protein